MDELGKNLEKALKAGIGAISSGLESSAQAIDKLAQKGEPLYEQAKSSVTEAAEKVKKALDDSNITGNISMLFGGKATIGSLKNAMMKLSKEELDTLRGIIDEIYEAAPDKKDDANECETNAEVETESSNVEEKEEQ